MFYNPTRIRRLSPPPPAQTEGLRSVLVRTHVARKCTFAPGGVAFSSPPTVRCDGRRDTNMMTRLCGGNVLR